MLSSRLLVDLDRVNFPVGLLEGGGVVGNIVNAGISQARARIAPNSASPLAAEGSVEDDLQRVEVGVDVATAPAVEGHDWSSPAGGVGVARGDIGRHGVVVPEPHVDAGARPLGGVDAASVVVEGGAVRVGGRGAHAAAGACVAVVAVGVGQGGSALGSGGIDGAAGCSVQSDVVGAVDVDTLDNINLSVVWPVGANKPVGGPGTGLN